jgi:membrane protease YdiL (CAAX protease family)
VQKGRVPVFTHLTDLHKGVIFYVIAFALVLGVTFLPVDGQTMLLAAMCVPSVTVALMLFAVTRDGFTRAGLASLGLHRLGIRMWPLAILAPLTVLGISYALVWTTGIGTFTPPADVDGVDGWITALLPGLIQALVVGTVTFSLAEELGWRGYLQPHLTPALGNVPGMALTGLLHGLFHMPLIFLTPYYHPDGNRWLIVPLFLTTFTIAGLLYGYMRLQTDSVWPACLAHSAHNYFWALGGFLTVAASPVAAEYLAGETGILPLVGYGIIAAWLLTRPSQPRASAPVPTDTSFPRAAHSAS